MGVNRNSPMFSRFPKEKDDDDDQDLEDAVQNASNFNLENILKKSQGAESGTVASIRNSASLYKGSHRRRRPAALSESGSNQHQRVQYQPHHDNFNNGGGGDNYDDDKSHGSRRHHHSGNGDAMVKKCGVPIMLFLILIFWGPMLVQLQSPQQRTGVTTDRKLSVFSTVFKKNARKAAPKRVVVVSEDPAEEEDPMAQSPNEHDQLVEGNEDSVEDGGGDNSLSNPVLKALRAIQNTDFQLPEREEDDKFNPQDLSEDEQNELQIQVLPKTKQQEEEEKAQFFKSQQEKLQQLKQPKASKPEQHKILSPLEQYQLRSQQEEKMQLDKMHHQQAQRQQQQWQPPPATISPQQLQRQEQDETFRKQQEIIQEQAQELANLKARDLAKQQAKLQAQQQAQELANEQARLQAQQQAQALAEQQAQQQVQAAELARGRAKLQAEQQAQELAREQVKLQAQRQAQELAAEQAKLQAQRQAQELAAEQAKLQAQRQAQELAAEQVKLQAQAQAKQQAAQKARDVAKQQAQQQAQQLEQQQKAQKLAQQQLQQKAQPPPQLPEPPGVRGAQPQKPVPPKGPAQLAAGNTTYKQAERPEIIPYKFQQSMANVWEPILPTDTPLFWHVPKNGGTTVADVLSHCVDLVSASSIGASEGHGQETFLEVLTYQDQGRYVNVNPASIQGINHAKQLGLAASGMAEVVVLHRLHEGSELFDRSHRARVFCMFRNPIHRTVSMFYYLQQAKWEPTYDPTLADMTLLQYVNSNKVEENWLTRFLVHQYTGRLTDAHVDEAMQIMRNKIVVGILENFQESMKRFELFFNWWENKKKKGTATHMVECQQNHARTAKNKVVHPFPSETDPAFARLEQLNWADMKLYRYAEQLFEEQRVFVKDKDASLL